MHVARHSPGSAINMKPAGDSVYFHIKQNHSKECGTLWPMGDILRHQTGLSITSGTAILLSVIFLLILQGCSGRVQTPEMITQPGATPQSAPSIDRAKPHYIIHPGDKLDVKFFYNEELNEEVVVRPDGRISLQLVHDVTAAGLNTEELNQVLAMKYEPYLQQPEVSVLVKKFDARKVYVDGEVIKPGVVEMGGYMDVLQAISISGGMKETALDDEVLIIRHNGMDRPYVIKVDMEKVRNGQDTSQNIALQSYDIIYVPKSAIAHVNTWVDLYIRKNIPIDFSFGLYKSVY